MAHDVSQTQDESTLYVWGGWDASGYHNVMYLYDKSTGASREVPLGLVRFLSQGFVSNPDWTWIPGKLLYLSADGQMTQERPTFGNTAIIGIAYSPTIICFSPGPPFTVS
jgi:hypothetical protein